MENSIPDISVVTPVFNEQEVLRDFYRQMSALFEKQAVTYEIIFIDDGSIDDSYEILEDLHQRAEGKAKVIRLARNFGQQLAITAGTHHAKGRAVVILDCDLQDPPDVVEQFIKKWREGYDVVYGVRSDRRGETWFKRWSAEIFYRILDHVADVRIPRNAGDFYLLDRKVVDELNRMDERHRFMRGLVAWAGFKRAAVEYVRQPRYAGVTKYGFFKMLKFSFDAITSFSFVPLRFIAIFGAGISLLAFIGILIVLFVKLAYPGLVFGWASLMMTILFMGGIQLLAIGVIGEYLARIGDDVKRRPLYTIQDVLE